MDNGGSTWAVHESKDTWARPPAMALQVMVTEGSALAQPAEAGESTSDSAICSVACSGFSTVHRKWSPRLPVAGASLGGNSRR